MSTALPRASQVLAGAIAAGVFPGAIVEVGRAGGALATLTQGAHTYASTAVAVGLDTIYDLASLTKVIGTTAVVARQIGAGRLRLDDPVRRWVPRWAHSDRERVTLRDLLEHCSGLPANRQYYQSLRGRDAFEHAICDEPLAYAPRTESHYSDPGFMLLGFLLETAGGAALDTLFDAWRDAEIGAQAELRYLPPTAWMARTAPTENSPEGAERRGQVHDQNAQALDGVAAHAGLFGTAASVGACARWWLRRATLLEGLLRRSAVPGSSRAIGWDTMRPTSSCGTRFSARAFGHTGFTGTSLWIDPEQDLYVALLANRVHPTREGDGIQPVRRALHDAVVTDLAEL